MTKEEAIAERLIRATHDEDRNKVYTFPPSGLFAAMESYATSQAIAFASWLDGNMYECFLMTDEGEKHWHDMDEKGNFTTSQLYTLFLSHQSKINPCPNRQQ